MSKDRISKAKRSLLMAKIRSKDTTPEMVVRKLIHSLGFRYRLHEKGLPGKPDLVFPKKKKVIFVNGCFWHGHYCKAGRNRPSSNINYWMPKLNRNVERDKDNQKQLTEMGGDVLVIWECEIQDIEQLETTINNFLKDDHDKY